MDRNDKSILFFFCLAVILLSAVLLDNVRPARAPGRKAARIDAAGVKAELERAGLRLHEAKHWILIEEF